MEMSEAFDINGVSKDYFRLIDHLDKYKVADLKALNQWKGCFSKQMSILRIGFGFYFRISDYGP